jgi:hypothetical protein
MACMLSGLGWDFEVISPAALRDEVLALSDRLRVSAVRGAVAGTTGFAASDDEKGRTE